MIDLSGSDYFGKTPAEMLALNQKQSNERLSIAAKKITDHFEYAGKSFMGEVQKTGIPDMVVLKSVTDTPFSHSFHPVDKLNRIPTVGDVVNIRYDLAGKASVGFGRSDLQTFADNMAEEINFKYSKSDRAEAVRQSRELNGQNYSGYVMSLAVDNIVIQHLGRGRFALHDAGKLDRIPNLGELADIRYDVNGRAKVAPLSIAPKGIAE